MKAFIIIDYINEITHEKWKLSTKGYYNFIQENNTFEKINAKIQEARSNNDLIIFVKLAFDTKYYNQPKESPLFGKAKAFGILQEESWGTEINDHLDFRKDTDIIVVKNRVNAFYQTNLNLILQNNNIKDIEVCGVATDLAVSSFVRDAHDRDYNVTILEQCCAAATYEDHKNSIAILSKLATII